MVAGSAGTAGEYARAVRAWERIARDGAASLLLGVGAPEHSLLAGLTGPPTRQSHDAWLWIALVDQGDVGRRSCGGHAVQAGNQRLGLDPLGQFVGNDGEYLYPDGRRWARVFTPAGKMEQIIVLPSGVWGTPAQIVPCCAPAVVVRDLPRFSLVLGWRDRAAMLRQAKSTRNDIAFDSLPLPRLITRKP